MNKSLIKLSKFLSLILRHRPQRIGITLDGAGWATVVTCISASIFCFAIFGNPVTIR